MSRSSKRPCLPSKVSSTETCRLQSGIGFLWKRMHQTAGSQRKVMKMKRVIAATLIASVVSIGMLGCTEKSSVKQETKIKTPGGTTTITTEKEIKKTGDHPPATTP